MRDLAPPTREIEEGLREYDDVALYLGRPLNYWLHDYRHVWDARDDRRKVRRRAADRLRDRRVERLSGRQENKQHGRLVKMLRALKHCLTCRRSYDSRHPHKCGATK